MIKVKVSELFDVVSQMKHDGMDYAVLTELDPIPEDDEPASLSFIGYKESDQVELDYDEINAV